MTAAERAALREEISQRRLARVRSVGNAPGRRAGFPKPLVNIPKVAAIVRDGEGLALVRTLDDDELAVYWRVLGACCTASLIDLAEHAALIAITAVGHRRRATRLVTRRAA